MDWTAFFSYCAYTITIHLGMQIFILNTRSRKELLKIGIFLMAEILLCFAVTPTREWQESTFGTDWISYFLISVTPSIFILSFKDEPLSKRFYSIIAGLMTRHAGTKLALLSFSHANIENRLLSISLSAIFILATYVPLYFILSRNISKDSDFSPKASHLIFIFIMSTIIILSAYLEPILIDVNSVGYIFLLVIEITFCYFVLGFQFILYKSEKERLQVVYERESAKRRVEQYEHFQGVIDVMNEKCHNLKHQIRDLSKTHNIDDEILEKLTTTVSEYEAFIKTGNMDIDVMLTEKSYICLTQNVNFTCMVDGSFLSFMSTEDLRSLFGNAIDNALEYLQTIEKEKRFLKVETTANEYFFKLSFENYFEGDIKFNDKGLPITKKEDKNYHGFGTKSIARIAKAYKGAYSFKAVNGIFKTEIIFPVSRKEEAVSKD